MSASFGEILQEPVIYGAPSIAAQIIRSRTWPDGFKQFYHCVNWISDAEGAIKVGAIGCTKIWRYLTQLQDLSGIERETARAIRKMATDDEPNSKDAADDTSDAPERDYKKHFDLLRHLGAQYWPPDLLAISINLPEGECGADFTYNYLMPDIGLDVALLDNPSDRTIRIRDVIGVLDNNRALRAPQRPEALGPKAARLGLAELVLSPHERLIVPLRAFALGGAGVDQWGSMDTARSFYRKIRAERTSSFSLSLRKSLRAPLTYRIVKDKGAFGPPEIPNKVEYSFGPQLYVTGFVVESESVNATPVPPSVLSLVGVGHADQNDKDSQDPADFILKVHETILTGESCPILYSWSEQQRAWVKHGKVIHTARGAENQATTVTEVGTEVRRIRLTEEEAETSFIRAVRLILTLHDGRRVLIDPVDNPISHAASWLKIRAFHKRDFSFAVPAEYQSVGIVRAEIAVTGYYERSGPLLSALPPASAAAE